MISGTDHQQSGLDPTGDPTARSDQEREAPIESSRLFADRKEVRIRHRGEIYRLRVTKNGKLILNK